eukprot:Filipodium_phascolosomae@DN602_c0_g1_i1.p1
MGSDQSKPRKRATPCGFEYCCNYSANSETSPHASNQFEDGSGDQNQNATPTSEEMREFYTKFSQQVAVRLIRDNGTGVDSFVIFHQETARLELIVGQKSISVSIDTIESVNPLGGQGSSDDPQGTTYRCRLQLCKGQYATLEFDGYGSYKSFHSGLNYLVVNSLSS